ncbi:MAG: transporter substrate-binding domain-containing protein [Anaerorhabdus sp.]
MKKILGVLIIMVLLVGCSGDNGSNEEVSTLVVGMECNYAPFNWSQTNETETAVAISAVDYCDGYDVSVAKKIADNLNKELKIVAVTWNGLIPALNNGEIDLIIAGMTKTEERSQAVNFSEPYYTSEMVMIVRKDDALTSATSIQDFSGKKVLGQINTLYDEIIDQIDGVIHVSPLKNYPRMVMSLQEGEVDALTAELPVAQGVVAANDDLAIVTFDEGNGFVADTTVSIAVAKDNTDLLEGVQAALDGISEEERVEMMREATNRQPAVE